MIKFRYSLRDFLTSIVFILVTMGLLAWLIVDFVTKSKGNKFLIIFLICSSCFLALIYTLAIRSSLSLLKAYVQISSEGIAQISPFAKKISWRINWCDIWDWSCIYVGIHVGIGDGFQWEPRVFVQTRSQIYEVHPHMLDSKRAVVIASHLNSHCGLPKNKESPVLPACYINGEWKWLFEWK